MIKCGIIQDLLPLYADKVCSEESKSLVEEHIKTCEKCKSELDNMQNGIKVNYTENNAAEIGVLKSLKKRIFRKNVMIAVIASVIVASLVLAANITYSRLFLVGFPAKPSEITVSDFHMISDTEFECVLTNKMGKGISTLSVYNGDEKGYVYLRVFCVYNSTLDTIYYSESRNIRFNTKYEGEIKFIYLIGNNDNDKLLIWKRD